MDRTSAGGRGRRKSLQPAESEQLKEGEIMEKETPSYSRDHS